MKSPSRISFLTVAIFVSTFGVPQLARGQVDDLASDMPAPSTVGTTECNEDNPLDCDPTFTPKDKLASPKQVPSIDGDEALFLNEDWCHGTYTSHFGRGTGTAVGFAMPFGQNLVAPAEVNVLACAQGLAVTVQGQSLTLSRMANTRQYSGTMNLGDGPLRTLLLTCDTDLNLRGQLVTADANLSIERPVWMLRDTPGVWDIADCEDPEVK